MNNVIIDGLGALIMAVVLFASRRSARDDTLLDRMLHRLMRCCIAVFLLDIPGLMLDGCAFPGARALILFFDTAYWLPHILYCWLWLMFADYWSFRSIERVRRLRVVYALPMLIELGVIAANPWTGWLFTIDAFNAYAPGTAYQAALFPHYLYIAASLAVCLRGFWASRDPERRRRGLAMLAYMFLPVCGAAMELLAYGVSWVWPMIALSLLMVYLSIQQQTIADEKLAAAEAAERAARMDAELTRSRTSIMLSQIQPHFLYNALCVIQDLCHGKAPEAERATIAFSRFLRGNLDSLKAEAPIPFARELDHTKYYLTLEAMRFGARLRVDYDIRAERFCLPAMTLQPIVENAVRYGVMKREEGGTVRIKSLETEEHYIVTVEDDGVGFDPYQKHADGRTHIGIDNVRQRLRQIGGDLTVVSRPGEGTTASLTLPKGGITDENSGA